MTQCKCGCGQEVRKRNRFIHGHNRRGEHHSDEAKRRIGASIAEALMGRSYENLYGEEGAQQLRSMRSERKKKHWDEDFAYKERMTMGYKGEGNHFYGKYHSVESRRKMSKSHIGIPLTNEHTKAIMIANNRRPNKTERQLLFVLGLPWQFVGDGKLVIGGKCPDFWDGANHLIELFGDYWHRGDNPEDRIEHFRKFGYGCEVIWEHELAALVESEALTN